LQWVLLGQLKRSVKSSFSIQYRYPGISRNKQVICKIELSKNICHHCDGYIFKLNEIFASKQSNPAPTEVQRIKKYLFYSICFILLRTDIVAKSTNFFIKCCYAYTLYLFDFPLKCSQFFPFPVNCEIASVAFSDQDNEILQKLK